MLKAQTCSTETNRNMETERGPPYHDSSPFPFLQPSTLLRSQAPTLPWRYSREAGLYLAHNFKAYAPSSFSCLPTQSLSSFYLYSLSSLRCSINRFPLLYSLCHPLSLNTSSPFPAPSLLFFVSYPPSFFSSESHQPKDIKGMSPPRVAVIRTVGQVSCQGQVPSGEDPEQRGNTCTLSVKRVWKK